jgi:hypothetical protein
MPFYARNLFYKEITLAGSNSYGYYNNISEFEMAYSIIHHKQNEYKSVLQNMYYIDDFKQ